MSPSVVLTPFQTYEVSAGKAVPLVYGDRNNPEPGLIINLDLTDVMTIGDDMGLNAGRLDTATVQPLQAVAYDGTRNIYGIMSPGGTALVEVAPGLTYWAPSPAQISAQISALGLATETTQLLVKSNTGSAATNTAATTSALTTGIALPVGAAKDVTVVGVNTSVQSQTGGGTIANEVAATGVPLLTSSSLVKNQTAISQNPGVVSTSATFSIKQIGYEIFLTIFAAGNFLSSYHLGMAWFDSATGVQTGQEDYWFVPGFGAGANAHTIIGTGPTKGDQLIITSEVPATSSVAVTHAYLLLENSRIYQEDDFQTDVFNTAGVTGAAEDSTAGILGAGNFNVGATGGIGSRMLPFFNGDISLWANTASGISDLDVQIVPFADPLQVGGASPPLFEARSNATGWIYASSVSLPAAQCQVLLTNGNGAARNLAFTAIISRQRT